LIKCSFINNISFWHNKIYTDYEAFALIISNLILKVSRNSFNNLPKINKKDAIEILNKPISEVEYSADYYKAVFHLANSPCEETEIALIDFIQCDATQLELKIAKRKAIEVLAGFDCKKAIPLITRYLNNDDSYLVETAIWALGELECNDDEIIHQISSILYKPFNNKRIVIQVLTKLGFDKEMEKIRSLSKDKNLSHGIRGASIAALIKLAGDKDKLWELRSFLRLSNQNDRHCAVQDIVHAGEISMIPFLLEAPISPSFKIEAIDSLWIEESISLDQINLINSLDSVILDDPKKIDNLEINYFENDIIYLINQLFHTDFNRCYFAMKKLLEYSLEEVLYYLNINWDRAKGDYGALYFFINLYRILLEKGFYDNLLLEKVDFLLSDDWPDYMKFKSSSMLVWSGLNDIRFYENFSKFSDERFTPYWKNRYTALLILENKQDELSKEFVNLFLRDSHRFVRLKANQICR
tara:strand:- start:5571 stop:6977 length:1407 start_codon:yes stop_codon:yes gene_type:complete